MMVETREWVLLATDRCDEGMCYAQAHVRLLAPDGFLDFCGHHYERHLKLGAGPKFDKIFYEVIDERERLVENRLQGED
jgi:hypothetical protein